MKMSGDPCIQISFTWYSVLQSVDTLAFLYTPSCMFPTHKYCCVPPEFPFPKSHPGHTFLSFFLKYFCLLPYVKAFKNHFFAYISSIFFILDGIHPVSVTSSWPELKVSFKILIMVAIKYYYNMLICYISSKTHDNIVTFCLFR